MKKSLLLFYSILITFYATGQKVVFNEIFDDMVPYSVYRWPQQFSSMAPWQVGVPYQVGPFLGGPMSVDHGPNYVTAIDGLRNTDTALIYSPAISLSGISSPWLSYDSYFLHFAIGGDTEIARVQISTDTGRTWNLIQNVPANKDLSKFTTYYFDLSAYANVPGIRVGFLYKANGVGGSGWAIDNVKLYVPAHKDIRMVQLYDDTLLNYVALGQTINHHCRVENYGLDTITEFTVSYKQDTRLTYSDHITGVTLPPHATYDVSFSVPDTVTAAGKHLVTMTATTTGDTIYTNDTAYTSVYGAWFMPKKHLMIEEGTGTHYYWAPRGWVFMNQISVPSDSLDVCIASVHFGDPMETSDYSDYFINCNIYPEFYLVDRKYNIGYDSFFSTLQKYKQHFGFADLLLTGSLNGPSLDIDVHVTPAVDLTGDYRLALVITEDTVTGTSADYDQNNKYAGGSLGPMGGFENKPNPVPAADMYYNFVARHIYPDPQGAAGSLPSVMLHNNTYDCTFNVLADHSWNVDRLRAIVMLINNGDSAVLNASRIYRYLEIPHLSLTEAQPLLYPNPAKSITQLKFNTHTAERLQISLMDISGRIVSRLPDYMCTQGNNQLSIPVSSIANGLYFIKIDGINFKKSLKLEILH